MVDDSSEHKKAKGANKNIVEKKCCHNKYRDILLNNKCLRHWMNRRQSKYHKIGTYEINKISLLWLDDKIYILNNGYDRLTLGYHN